MDINQQTQLYPLIPRYAEYGLKSWLDNVAQIIPIQPTFLGELLKQVAHETNWASAGYTLGKIIDLAARQAFHTDITEALTSSFTTQTSTALESMMAAVRHHLKKTVSTDQYNSSRYGGHTVDTQDSTYNILWQIWNALERVAAMSKRIQMDVGDILLLLWRDHRYSPVKTHDNGLGGFYRYPLTALLLQTQQVEYVYRGILDWQRKDVSAQWCAEHPYEPFSRGDAELCRQHCFQLLYPEGVCGYDIWLDTAATTNFSELCELLRCAAHPKTQGTTLPTNLTETR